MHLRCKTLCYSINHKCLRCTINTCHHRASDCAGSSLRRWHAAGTHPIFASDIYPKVRARRPKKMLRKHVFLLEKSVKASISAFLFVHHAESVSSLGFFFIFHLMFMVFYPVVVNRKWSLTSDTNNILSEADLCLCGECNAPVSQTIHYSIMILLPTHRSCDISGIQDFRYCTTAVSKWDFKFNRKRSIEMKSLVNRNAEKVVFTA